MQQTLWFVRLCVVKQACFDVAEASSRAFESHCDIVVRIIALKISYCTLMTNLNLKRPCHEFI